MLAIDDRLIEHAIQIGRKIQPVIDEDDPTFEIDMREDLGSGREAPERFPEFRRAAPGVVEVIEQQVRNLMRRNEGAPITSRCHPFGENGPVDPAFSLRTNLGLTRRQPPEIAPSGNQRGAGRGKRLAESLLGGERWLHNLEMETGALHFKGVHMGR